jgi:LPS export ABC transporter permease LptG/LPS export ABC transporter permease LptF
MATLLPQALALAIPFALLIGLLVAFGRLSADREFVALQACGVGLRSLLRPVTVVALLGWAATSYVMLVALPNANQTYRDITFSLLASRAEGEVKPRTFFLGFPDLALYVRDVPPTGGWNGVFMADNRGGQTPATYFARHGRVLLDPERRTVQMLLEDGARHAMEPNGDYRVLQFKQLVVSVNPDTVFPRQGPQKGDNEMTIAELRARAAEIEKAGESAHNQYMAIHRKFSIPVACLVFGLIGLSLGATNRRDGKMGSFVFGLGVTFLYYVPLFLGPAMAKGHLMPPWLAVWFPNILLGIAGVFLLLRRARSADQPIVPPLPARFRRLFASEAAATADTSSSRMLATGSARGRSVATILDRYVASTYARVFSIAALGLAGLFYISTFLDLSDKVFKGQATWGMLAQFFWYTTPQYVYYVVPLSVLLATLVTIGVLTKNSELVVMKACGISLYRVGMPMLAGAVLSGTVLFVLDQSILGPANRRAEQIRHVMRGGSLETFDVLNRQWMTGSDGEIYHYNYFDPDTRQLLGLEVFDVKKETGVLARRTYAERAVYETDNRWKVERGWRRDFDAGGDITAVTQLTDTAVPLEPAASFATREPDPKFMSYTELRGHIAGLEPSGFDVSELRVALDRKLAFPFVTLIMTLIAVPFAVTTGRRGAMYGVGIGIALAISYWVAISVFAALGSGGVVAPLVAAWAPNFLFGAGAAYLLLTVRT